jgi:hypothetical protein
VSLARFQVCFITVNKEFHDFFPTFCLQVQAIAAENVYMTEEMQLQRVEAKCL